MTDFPDDRFARLFEGGGSAAINKVRCPATESKAVTRKEQWATERRFPPRHDRAGRSSRLPPGQELTRDWPVLDLGERPLVDPAQLQLTVGGAVERPLKWSWTDLMAQPQVDVTWDIHCVTAWSKLDARWRGIAVMQLLSIVRPRPTAKFVVLHGYNGYTTSLPLARFAAPGALLAHAFEGKPLSREHGGPLRAVIPDVYFWKSAKWLRHVAILEKEAPGFWEARGYHADGDPWKEQRYG